MFTLFRRALRTLVAVIAILGLAAAPALGANSEPRNVEHRHESFDFVVEDFSICGYVVRGEFEGRSNVVVKDGLTQRTDHRRFVWRNANGTLELATAGRQAERSVVDNGDGTITLTSAVSGSQRFTGPDGVIAAGNGRVVIQDVIELGDPDDPDDDVLVSSTVVSTSGSHSDIPLCRIFDTALG